MIQFSNCSVSDFLSHYWQKKPFIFRKALPDFINPLTPDELAGLALEEDIESRIVMETPSKIPQWHLKKGPFTESDFAKLPSSHWTLLVQGVDRIVPEIFSLLDHFDFIPQWRIDDVMISFASLNGSVGPHYDNYDVFLYQAQGKRHWALTSKNCHQENYIQDLELRIMKEFDIEEEYILEEGDMLYLPAHIGHYGRSLSDQCMTFSFGYRSYSGQELWDSLGDYMSEHSSFPRLYKDPDWSTLKHSSKIEPKTWQQAKQLMQELLEDEHIIQSWFGCFATRLDQQAEQQLSYPLEEDDIGELPAFIQELYGKSLVRDPCCRFAYSGAEKEGEYRLFINGHEWCTKGITIGLIELIANNRVLKHEALAPYLNESKNQSLLYELWTLQWLHFNEA